MGLFSRTKAPATRGEMLDLAARARGKGDRAQAVAVYGAWLEAHPDDHEVHGKVAPLHLELKQRNHAWGHFDAAAEGYARAGFYDKALAIWKQAVEAEPERVDGWERAADMHVLRGRRAEAIATLDGARALYRGRKRRALAARVLAKRLALDPAHTPTVLDLAAVRRKLGETDAAVQLLAAHLAVVDAGARRRVLAALFFARPTPAALWRWARGR
jgi:tetratricopeptide (TPR) repeat protein